MKMRLTAEATPAKPKNGAYGGHRDIVEEAGVGKLEDDKASLRDATTLRLPAHSHVVTPSLHEFTQQRFLTQVLNSLILTSKQSSKEVTAKK